MLGIDDADTCEKLIKSLPLRVKVPEALATELSQRGLHGLRHDDLRRAPRFRCCGMALLLPVEGFLDCFNHSRAVVIVKDLSRTGVGFLAHEQWYPDQEFSLLTPGAEVHGRVVRVRYVDQFCYSVGGLITRLREFDPSSSQS